MRLDELESKDLVVVQVCLDPMAALVAQVNKACKARLDFLEHKDHKENKEDPDGLVSPEHLESAVHQDSLVQLDLEENLVKMNTCIRLTCIHI